MSHTTTIKGVQIKSISAIQRAVKHIQSMGIECEMLENTKARAYYQKQGGMEKPADICIKLKNSRYDVGLYRQDDGTYEPRFDAWGGDISQQLGNKAGKQRGSEHIDQIGTLLTEYAVAAASITAEAEGKFLQRTEGKDGAVKLTVTGY